MERDVLRGQESDRLDYGQCLYLKQDPSQPRILGFLDYYTGKRIAHLDPDGELATD